MEQPLPPVQRLIEIDEEPRLLALGIEDREHVLDGDRWLDFTRSADDD